MIILREKGLYAIIVEEKILKTTDLTGISDSKFINCRHPVIVFKVVFRFKLHLNNQLVLLNNHPVGVAFNNIAIGAGGHGFDSWTNHTQCGHRCDVFGSCVAQALSFGDGSRHLLHVSA